MENVIVRWKGRKVSVCQSNLQTLLSLTVLSVFKTVPLSFLPLPLNFNDQNQLSDTELLSHL